MNRFKDRVLDALVAPLRESSQTIALWEGGSAANGTSDPYSDVDLTIIGQDSIESVFDLVEATLNSVFVVSHCFIEPKCFWPGCYQRIYLLEGAPKYFFVDVAVFLKSSEDLLLEFLQSERHGFPVVHFDKLGLVKPRSGDLVSLKVKQRKRLAEIEAAYPVYKIEVLKELDRGNAIDAFAFYFLGMVRPLVELMGMIHRPFRYDFGLRYLHKTFPDHDRQAIESLLYVKDINDLKDRATTADHLFQNIRLQVRPLVMNAEVARALPTDAEAIQQVYADAYRENRKLGFPGSAETATVQEIAGWISADKMWVAKLAGEIVGAVRLRDTGSEFPTLGRLGVASKHKRAGVGKLLMDAVEDDARQRGCKGVTLTVAKDHPVLMQIYIKRGYEIIGSRSPQHPIYDEIVMRKTF